METNYQFKCQCCSIPKSYKNKRNLKRHETEVSISLLKKKIIKQDMIKTEQFQCQCCPMSKIFRSFRGLYYHEINIKKVKKIKEQIVKEQIVNK